MSSVLDRQNEAAMLHGPCCYFLQLRSDVLRKQGRIADDRQQQQRRHFDTSSATPHHHQKQSVRPLSSRPSNENDFTAPHSSRSSNQHVAAPQRPVNPPTNASSFPSPPSIPLGVLDVNSQKLPEPGALDVKFDKASEQPTFTGPQVECPYCYRSFNGDRVERHVIACKKTHDKKAGRTEFDAKAIRVKKLYQDTDVDGEDVLRRIDSEVFDGPNKAAKKKDWRKDSERFQKMIRGEETEPAADDRVVCPGCSRKFASHAADRHIPKCLERVRR